MEFFYSFISTFFSYLSVFTMSVLSTLWDFLCELKCLQTSPPSFPIQYDKEREQNIYKKEKESLNPAIDTGIMELNPAIDTGEFFILGAIPPLQKPDSSTFLLVKTGLVPVQLLGLQAPKSQERDSREIPTSPERCTAAHCG